MIVKITYDDKRLDVFDTSTFTSALPLGKQNMLTNFEVRFDDMGFDGLWLTAHSYQADETFKKDTAENDVPVARRTKDWRFLLASAAELEHVELVVVDGEAIVKRVLGELIDLQSFDEKAYECIGSPSKGLHERICELYAYLQKLTEEAEPCVPGVPRSVVSKLVAVKLASEAEEGSAEKKWGDLDEVGW
ncbi:MULTISPECIES: hypothetical protein [unclassified Adlercreutzia]|uniref:hypothetical protein n=1 Tax=unclassified Adlercreutzia TaxID=2636013 RepID=UPI0013EE39B6|nr:MULTISPECIES: hypothetical protein [unclassified Adlercreutzia]